MATDDKVAQPGERSGWQLIKDEFSKGLDLTHGTVHSSGQADRVPGTIPKPTATVPASKTTPSAITAPKPPVGPNAAVPNHFDKGGKVLKTGLALVHEGEEIKPKEDTMEKGHNVSLYRAMHHLNKGGLHRALGIPEGEKIPKDKLNAAKNSKNEHVARMANFAETMGKFK